MLAKIASGYNKPNGVTLVPLKYISSCMAELPVKNIRHCGRKIADDLSLHGINTMGDVLRSPVDKIAEIL
jgi:DNA polymerase-4